MIDTTAALARGLRRHQAGQLAQAELEYRAVLTGDPENGDALHLLGLVAEAGGDLEMAGSLMARAIGLRGPVAEYCANLGRVLYSQGKLAQAKVCNRQAADALVQRLELHAGDAAGWRLLGGVFLALDSPCDALDALRHAAELRPGWAEAQHDLGLALARADRLEEAEQVPQRAARPARFSRSLE